MNEMETEPLAMDESEVPEPEKEYGGIGRLAFFFGLVGLGLINVLFSRPVRYGSYYPFSDLSLGLAIVMVLLTAARLRNIGKNLWLSILILIPIANLWVLIPCLIGQKGYNDTKELDKPGRIINAIIFCTLALMLLGFIIVGLISLFTRR